MIEFHRVSDGRFYAIKEPYQDLLGDWCVETFRGGRCRAGHWKTLAIQNEREARAVVEWLMKIRLQHHYVRN